MRSILPLLVLLTMTLSACGGSPNGSTAEAVPSATAVILSGLTPSVASQAAPCATPEPDFVNTLEARSVTAADSGKTLTLHVTSRFSFYLDDTIYPLQDLEKSIPTDLLGYISNGSILGPQCYPVMYEAVREGQALIKVNDFQLTVIVNDNLPQSTFPLH